MQKTKSPIKDLPIHGPGQSLEKHFHEELENKILFPFISMFMLVYLAGFEWAKYYFNIRPNPWLYTILAILGAAWVGIKLWRNWPELKNLRTGFLGEKAVGQHLEECLGTKGYHVLHDIPGDNFNLDHVVIGPTGVFSIETKTRSRPAGTPTVIYDGKTVSVNGQKPERNPIIQAKAAAQWLRELLEKSTSKKFPVQPIVIFPDWFIESSANRPEVWVLNHKAAVSFVQNNHGHLAAEDISLILLHLKRYVISADEKTAF